MAPHAVQVTMSQSWKGIEEEFSNIFHYDLVNPIDTEAGWAELGDQIVAAMKPMFAADVTFKRVRIHGPTHLTKIEDVMLSVRDIVGTGSAAAGDVMPPEFAVVAFVYVGRGPRGGKQFLRKYLHTRRLVGAAAGSGKAWSITPLSAADKTLYITQLNTLKTVSVGGFSHDICTPSGKHLPVGSSWDVMDYTAVRQFRRRSKRKLAA